MTNVAISKKVFNGVYLPYLNDDHRFLIFYGGGGSGKSYFIAQLLIMRMMQSDLCNVLVCRQVARTNRDSTFALLRSVISNWGLDSLFTVHRGELRITCQNGNEMVFAGLDDPEKLKSITFAKGELTTVWLEEASEMSKAGLEQVNIRLRGGKSKKQVIISFNPIDVNHWLKGRFFDRAFDNVQIVHTTYKDNQFIDDEYREQLEAYKELDPYYYAVYCLGQWGVYGRTIFNAAKVQERLDQLTGPVAVGEFTYDYDGIRIRDIRFTEREDGCVCIYRQPEKGESYAVGGDTAGDGSDYFVGQVVDRDGVQVATLRQSFDEDEYARQMYCLGTYYNKAILAVETNYSTHPVRELERLGYERLYVRERVDTYTHRPTESYGFVTNSKTRPIILAELVAHARDHMERFADKTTLEEMLTFVRNEKGRPEASVGAHDDCIMALAIALHAREQMVDAVQEAVYNTDNWTADMWEDYHNTDEEGKAYLLQKWA